MRSGKAICGTISAQIVALMAPMMEAAGQIIAPTAAQRWTVIRMTAADDLIRRQDAIKGIRSAMKRICTAARRQGYKECMDILDRLPSTKELPVSLAAPVSQAPGLGHSHWFTAGGYRLCDNCGGKGDLGRPTAYCPHCGFRMDELDDLEIE